MKSPCTGRCMLNRYACTGCGRTRREIAHWSGLTDAKQARIIEAAAQRLTQLKRSPA